MRNTIYLFLIICIVLTPGANTLAQDNLNVTRIGSLYDFWDSANCVVVEGDYAYVTDGHVGLRIVYITRPEAPTETGFCYTPGYSRGVVVRGDYAYVADGPYGGLRIVDISNPEEPVETGFHYTEGCAYGIAINSNLVYLADGEDGIRIYDASNPADPVEVGFYDTDGVALGVAVSGNDIYLADQYNFKVLQYTGDRNSVQSSNLIIPMGFGIQTIYPNPFNPTTTITYDLSVASPVSLHLYDLAGLRIRTLIEGNRQAGVHQTTFEAADLPSGLYFVRLEASGQVAMQKAMLIK